MVDQKLSECGQDRGDTQKDQDLFPFRCGVARSGHGGEDVLDVVTKVNNSSEKGAQVQEEGIIDELVERCPALEEMDLGGDHAGLGTDRDPFRNPLDRTEHKLFEHDISLVECFLT